MTPLLTLQHIYRSYPSGDQEVVVLKDINLAIYPGEMVAIIGASGSGKSTLMNILGCLDKANQGQYLVNGTDVAGLDVDQLARLRREHFGFIFQRYHLLPHLSAEHNVEVPAVYAGVALQARRQAASQLLTRLGLAERMHYLPGHLSGGQQQRVSIARALINGGQVILADEPTGALDSHSGKEVMEILQQLRDRGHTVVIVTHDPQIAAQAERIIEIKDGEIISDSRPQPPTQARPSLTNKVNSSVLQPWQQSIGRFREALSMAWRAMVANKMRTALTMLGIIIGIASVVSIIVIGDAAKNMVLADLKEIGTNTINIYPGKGFGENTPEFSQSLKQRDLNVLSSQPYIQAVSPSIGGSTTLRYGNINVDASVTGVSNEYFKVYGLTFSQGQGLTADQMTRQAQVVVIDENTKKRLFPQQSNVIGQIILLGNMPVTITGVVKQKQSVFGNDSSLQVWIPYTSMTSRVLGQVFFGSITVRMKEGYNSKQAEQQITRLLTLLHGQKDFFTYNMDSLLKTAEKTTHTLQLFLTLVAVISLIVGGIGVMNIMLVSVTERTREIGIRMAVGARSSDVLQQFLIEAVLVCLVGGALGIVLSLAIGMLIQLFLPSWLISFPPMAIISAFICSTAIGVIFGFLPARSAAKLNPIDALARE